MKKFVIVLQLVMLIAVSCKYNPIDETSDDDFITKIDTREIPLGYTRDLVLDTIGISYGEELGSTHQFRTLEFNTAYVFTSLEQYLQAMSADTVFKDVNVGSTVDFSNSSIVAVTGLASSYIRNIEHKFYLKSKTNTYHLDIFVDVADTCRVAHKWNLLLEIPVVMSDDEKVVCSVRTNQEIKPVEPDYLYVSGYSSTYPIEGSSELLHYGWAYLFYSRHGIAPYGVVFKEENRAEIIRRVNEHPTATLLREGSRKIRPEYYGENMGYDYICNCEYADFIEPNRHLFERVYAPYGFHIPYHTGWSLCMPHPVVAFEEFPYNYHFNIFTPLINHIGTGFCRWQISFDTDVLGLVMDEKKIHWVDFLTIIGKYYLRKEVPYIAAKDHVGYEPNNREWVTNKPYEIPDETE